MRKFVIITVITSAIFLISYNIRKVKSIAKKNQFCPEKIVSLMVGLDEITYQVARNKLTGVSYLSFNPKISNISSKLQNVKPLKVEINSLLNTKPDLILFSKFSNTNLINVIINQGIRVEFFDRFNSLTDIEDNIKRIANITCQPHSGKKLIKWINRIKNRLRRRCKKVKNKLRTIFISLNLMSAGERTIVSDILELACLKNIIKENGLSLFPQLKLEDILRYNPDIIILDDWIDIESFFARYVSLKKLKAYQHKRIVQIENKLIMATSHYSFLTAYILFNRIYRKPQPQ